MAVTQYATGDAETVKRWAKEVWMEMPREIFFGKFHGKPGDMNAMIETKRDLQGQPGDRLDFTLIRKLSTAGVSGDSVLEGQEEELTRNTDSVSLDQRRNGVLLAGRLSERRTMYDQRMTAKAQLKVWCAETLDDDHFTQFSVSPATSRIVYGGNATATGNIGSDDVISPARMDFMVAIAKKASPKIWPVRINGRDWYVLLIHTDVAYDLHRDSEWNTSIRDAQGVKWPDNPIFTGALHTWRGCVVHEHEDVPIATNWGASGNEPGASNLFLGRQAGLFAWGSPPQAWEKEFDYGARMGFAIGAIWGMTKAVFNAVDHSFIEFRTYRTNTGS
jgi:N4-gp56 family major capsid protein